ncbi:MAG: GNAT family N-acetyltransferase [Ponticaulis sp.]|nr:GNAT family N-acetyltransferase [Ponticaulis sp.]
MPFDFQEAAHFGHDFEKMMIEKDWLTYTILDRETTRPLGMASYMRQRPEHGSIEVGCVAFSPALRRTIAATEAMYLMAAHVFDDLHYRRYEWKCHNKNTASKNAALRFGFQFEGVHRNDMVMKGTSRDTAWFAMTDDDWPGVKAAFKRWLSPDNFDENGQQKLPLSALQAAHAQHPPEQQQQ